MMTITTEQAAALRRSINFIARAAADSSDFETGDAIGREAVALLDLLDLIELEAAPACEDESLIAA